MRYLAVPAAFLLVSLLLVQQGVSNPGFPGNAPPVAGPTAPLPRIVGVGGVVGWAENLTYSSPYNASSFCFAHLSDFQLQDPWSQDLEPVKAALRNIDGITPAFAVVTGDLSEYGWPSEWELYKSLERILTVPVYPVPGNHETYGDPFLVSYRALIGPPNYTFDFLGHLFVGLDSSTPRLTQGSLDRPQLQWLEGVLKEARDRRARTVTLFSHHGPVQHPQAVDFPLFGGFLKLPGIPLLRDRDAALELIERYGVDHYLIGHEHLNWEERRGGTWYLITGDIAGKPYDDQPVEPKPVHSYRLVCLQNNEVTFREWVPRDGGLTVNRSEDGKEVRIRNTFSGDYPLAVVRLPVCRNEPVEGGFVQAIDRGSCTTYVGARLPAGRENVVRVVS
jgi:3',5'-cyclic AMP phosphodiesterase CpdA